MISLLFFVLYFDGTKEYYKRIQNSTVVVGKVVNSTYKEREVIEVDLDDVAYTTYLTTSSFVNSTNQKLYLEDKVLVREGNLPFSKIKEVWEE